ncbi:MAG TPA: prolyl oligopeptidase family serine peptidase [Actinospica sp.]|jgi:prolyl oligopeptidase|nr:prolyl oligopeptidase family serine peptidase [Actinospica sp.]
MPTTDSPFPPSAYPAAERLDLVEDLHGHRVADPYRWLEDPAAAQTVAWSAAQDELFAAFQAALPDGGAQRAAFRARVGELADAGAVTAPVWRGQRCFFTRRAPGQDHPVLLTAGQDGAERVLIDPSAIDPSGATTLDLWFPSRDGALLVYQLSEGGTEESLLRVMDVATGDLVDGPIDRTRYAPVAWLPDDSAFYYTRRLAPDQVPEGESQYYRRVYLHRLGTDPAEDVLVFGEGLDKTNFYGITVSRDGRWIGITTYRGTSRANDLHVADLTESGPDKPRWIAVQQDVDAGTDISFGRDGRFYLRTDRDAPNARLCVVDPDRSPDSLPDALGYGQWRDVLPENPKAVLEDYVILEDTVLALYSWHGVSELNLFDLATGELLTQVATPNAGSIPALHAHQDGGTQAWFGYLDHVTPVKVLAFDARTRELTTWADTPGTIELGDVHVTRLMYPSKDGTAIPMTILAPAAEPDRPRPTILYGYGGFTLTITPDFNALRLAWVEAGGVFAIANLRGGNEEGEDWHRAGRLDKKQNVFDDFHAAGDHLTATGWTTREQLGVFGGSNGGLLVGAALTQRPDAYAAVVCSAPLLDMIRYERFGLGALWNVEYGSASVPEEFEWLLGYSPYHHVHEGTAYPATLFTIFESDSRVDTLHARKLAAALQHATSGPIADRPILVRREHNVGHSTRSISRSLTLWADQLSFFAHQLGL